MNKTILVKYADCYWSAAEHFASDPWMTRSYETFKEVLTGPQYQVELTLLKTLANGFKKAYYLNRNMECVYESPYQIEPYPFRIGNVLVTDNNVFVTKNYDDAIDMLAQGEPTTPVKMANACCTLHSKDKATNHMA